jgi:hypothetical protein
MKPDYLELSDGRKVRVEWNMNALTTFTSITGMQMTDLINARADARTLRTIAWCAAIEGEDADGRTFEVSEKEFGRLMSMAAIVKFSEIMARQSGNEGEKKSLPPEKPIRIFLRKIFR